MYSSGFVMLNMKMFTLSGSGHTPSSKHGSEGFTMSMFCLALEKAMGIRTSPATSPRTMRKAPKKEQPLCIARMQ